MEAGDRATALRFGISIVPATDNLERIRELVRTADDSGLDLVGIQDHPYQRRFLETWSLLAFLATRTERVRLFPDVANLPLRNPAVLAKAAATIDLLSDGRFELGLGAGAFWDGIHAMGGPVRNGPESVEALEEAIAVIRAMWSRGLADGWVPSLSRLPLAEVPRRAQLLEAAAEEAGRDPASIRRVANVNPSEGFLDGPVEQWVEQLAGLHRDHGFDGFVLWSSEDSMEQLERFAEEVAPAVRRELA
jgi:alkanesulfonate monooxygenase SsuD/methylene tetrahydromethanopterin reductase-like flavin-dependent oxidoreductase (luciferase family)